MSDKTPISGSNRVPTPEEILGKNKSVNTNRVPTPEEILGSSLKKKRGITITIRGSVYFIGYIRQPGRSAFGIFRRW